MVYVPNRKKFYSIEVPNTETADAGPVRRCVRACLDCLLACHGCWLGGQNEGGFGRSIVK